MPTLTFGKYKGRRLDSVPLGYLEWLQRERIDRPAWLPGAVARELSRRRYRREYGDVMPPREQPQTGVVLADAVRRWFNRLSLQHHPDRGGSNLAMQIVNQAHAMLKEELRL